MIVVGRQTNLVQVVLAAGAGGRLTHFLDGRQEQPHQNGDDGDHHEKLDEREAHHLPSKPNHDFSSLTGKKDETRQQRRNEKAVLHPLFSFPVTTGLTPKNSWLIRTLAPAMTHGRV